MPRPAPAAVSSPAGTEPVDSSSRAWVSCYHAGGDSDARQLLVQSIAYSQQNQSIESFRAVEINNDTATSSACKSPWKRTSGREIHIPSLASQVHILTKLPRLLVLRTDQQLTAGLTTCTPSKDYIRRTLAECSGGSE